MKKIVIDLMGSDLGEKEIFLGGIMAAKSLTDYGFVFVGNWAEIEKDNKLLQAFNDKSVASRLEFIDAKEVFLNTDSPMDIPHGREETSLVKGFLKTAGDDDVIAFLSCGSTGGLLVGSIFRLGLVPGLRFPTLASPALDRYLNRFTIVDCGANLDCDAKTLLKFGKLGSAFASCYVKGTKSPRVALLNVGKEKGKGNAVLKEAYPLFEESSLNFVGNIEGDSVYNGLADVVVCDGYAGNVLIKACEHLSEVVLSMVRESFADVKDADDRVAAIRAKFNYNEEGTAIVLGSKKICLKGHGTSKRKTILSGCLLADELYRNGFLEAMGNALVG